MELGVRRQCELVGPSRATYYRGSAEESADDLALMRRIDEQYTACPFTAAGGSPGGWPGTASR